MAPFKKITLENGLRIILAPQPTSTAATVLVLVEAGSKYETKDINGLSHFLEHMCFKGTLRRPSAFAIAGELDGIGANYNAFTGQEFTGYFAKARPAHFDTILDVVSDIYVNQIFDAGEIDKERGVIIEEINMYEDLPMRRVQELFTTLLYGDQPAGWDIGGRKEVIQKLTREEFLNYRAAHYLPQSTIVIAAGAFDEEQARNDIERIFSGIQTGGKVKKVKTIEKQETPQVLVKEKETDQTHLVLGVRAFDIFDKRRYALEVLADILGGGMSSRLFQVVREEMGAAYYVRAATDFYTDHGYMAASAGVDNKKLEAVITAMVKEFKKIAETPLEIAELKRAQEHLAGKIMLGLETSDALAEFYGEQEVITGAIKTPQEVIQKIQSVTADDVQSVAREIMKNDRLNLALIGPVQDKGKLENILKL